MKVFRCYITGSDGHFRDVALLEATSDREALKQAKALPATHAGFELWDGARLIYRELATAAMPIKMEDHPARVSYRASHKTVIKKLEHIAASIGETLWGARLPALAKSKEKRRPRN